MISPLRVMSVSAATLLLSASFAQSENNIFDGMSLGIGAFAFVGPAYEGSDEYRVGGIPFAFPVFEGSDNGERSRLSIGGADDVRISVFRRAGFDIGPIVGYSFGRDEDLSDKLSGLGDIDGGLVLGGFGSYTAGGFSAAAGIASQVTGGEDNGFEARFSASYTQDITDRLSLTGTVGTEYASSDYMERYFSVTANQAASSRQGYHEFDAGAGFKNVSSGLSLSYQATERLDLRANAGFSRLVGDAADSPISESDNQFSGGVGFIFRF